MAAYHAREAVGHLKEEARFQTWTVFALILALGFLWVPSDVLLLHPAGVSLFGALRAIQTLRGIKQKRDYSLHPQSSWRLIGGDSVLLGSSYLYHPADGREDRSDFDWDVLVQAAAMRL